MLLFRRLSRSEPLIDNKESVEKVVTNGTVEPHRNLQSFRKIPKTRISSWGKNFDLLLSDKGLYLAQNKIRSLPGISFLSILVLGVFI